MTIAPGISSITSSGTGLGLGLTSGLVGGLGILNLAATKWGNYDHFSFSFHFNEHKPLALTGLLIESLFVFTAFGFASFAIIFFYS